MGVLPRPTSDREVLTRDRGGNGGGRFTEENAGTGFFTEGIPNLNLTEANERSEDNREPEFLSFERGIETRVSKCEANPFSLDAGNNPRCQLVYETQRPCLCGTRKVWEVAQDLLSPPFLHSLHRALGGWKPS